jgi:phage tail-like protein
VLEDVDTAVSLMFTVKLDDVNLGAFSSCDGLGAEVVLETREEGGQNSYVWQLPSRLKYPNIKLSRPLGRDTQKIADWFASMANGYQRKTATIEAKTSDGQVVATWSLQDVVPVRWTGPALNAEAPKILTETIEIAHHGFLPSGS